MLTGAILKTIGKTWNSRISCSNDPYRLRNVKSNVVHVVESQNRHTLSGDAYGVRISCAATALKNFPAMGPQDARLAVLNESIVAVGQLRQIFGCHTDESCVSRKLPLLALALHAKCCSDKGRHGQDQCCIKHSCKEANILTALPAILQCYLCTTVQDNDAF